MEACFRLDAGFGTYDDIALLIKMGYEAYVRLHNHQIVQMLRARVTTETTWERVGDNATMVAWSGFQLQHCPGAVYTGKTHTVPASFREKHSDLAHLGSTPVTTHFRCKLIRWATVWMDQHVVQQANTLPLGKMRIRKQVLAAAHTSGKVIQNSEGMLLKFSPLSAFAGMQLFFQHLSGCYIKIVLSFSTILALMVQKLR